MTTTNSSSQHFIESPRKVTYINDFKFGKIKQFLKKCQEAIMIKQENSNFTSLDPNYLTNCIDVLENGELMLRCQNTRYQGEKVLYNITDNELVWSNDCNSSECQETYLRENIIYYLNDNNNYAWFSVILNQNGEIELTTFD